MKIGLVGYGKMGKAIEEIALSRNHEIVFKATSQSPFESQKLNEVDVVIEFTKPDLAVKHIVFAIEKDIPIVVGTTAWNEHLPQITTLIHKKDGALLYASNFSIGVNMLFFINEKLAALMNNYPEYNAEISEIHHLQKIDHPSGTAVSLANGIIENNDFYSGFNEALNSFPTKQNGILPIAAYREPDVPGTHLIRWNSEVDEITLSHQAHNRQGFALGAVIAAEFLYTKKGVFTMRDVFQNK